MRTLIYGIFFIVFTSISCRNPAKHQANSEITAAENPRLINFDKNRVNGAGQYAFDFKSPFVTPANSYWLGLLSSAAYADQADVVAYVKKAFDNQILNFRFYSPTELNGISAESFYIQVNGGWILTFRGTAGVDDWVINLKRTHFNTKGLNENGDFSTLYIHTGFYESASSVFNLFISDYLKNQEIVTYDSSSPEAYKYIDAALRGLASEADVFVDFSPDVVYKPGIARLKQLNMIKSDSSEMDFLGVLNIWAEELANLGLAQQKLIKGTISQSQYDAVVSKSITRKTAAVKRVHKYFVFRKYEPVWLTGHSLGGALAQLSSYFLMKLGIPFQGLVTFGSPRVGNPVFKSEYELLLSQFGGKYSIARFQNHQDIIPLVPKLGGDWIHISKPWFYSSSLQLYIPNLSDKTQTPLYSQTDVSSKWANYKSTQKVNFYDKEDLLPDQTSIWNTDLTLKTHDMTTDYLKILLMLEK